MKDALIITAFLAFIAWLIYEEPAEKRIPAINENYIKDTLSRYPFAESMEKLVQSAEWARLLKVYDQPPGNNNRFRLLYEAITRLYFLPG